MKILIHLAVYLTFTFFCTNLFSQSEMIVGDITRFELRDIETREIVKKGVFVGVFSLTEDTLMISTVNENDELLQLHYTVTSSFTKSEIPNQPSPSISFKVLNINTNKEFHAFLTLETVGFILALIDGKNIVVYTGSYER